MPHRNDRNRTSRKSLSALVLACIWQIVFLPALAQVSTDKNAMPSTMPSDASTIRAEANRLFWLHKYAEARAQLLKMPASQRLGKEPRYLINLAICESQMDNWVVAGDLAKRALKLLNTQQGASNLDISDAESTLANCLVVEGNVEKARDHFQAALTAAEKSLGEWNTDAAPMYEGLAACDYVQKKYAEAEPFYRKVAVLDYLKFGPDEPHLGWSFLFLSDIYWKLGKHDLAEQLYKKVFWNFRKQNEDRALKKLADQLQSSGQAASLDSFKPKLEALMFGTTGATNNRECGIDWLKKQIPENATGQACRLRDFNNWFRDRAGREEAPGRVILDPRLPLRCWLICIHGLSLNRDAYDAFAEEICKQGVGVISFDVRGFGSYRNDPAYQRIDFDAIIGDIKQILAHLRSDYPQVPLYVLGESMGGAIALRIGAVAPDLVDAVVSSVPAGRRFGARKTDLNVAYHWLTNKHKQFDIGTRIVDRATKDASLRAEWADDPETRLKLSASELFKFNHFMNQNIKYVHDIKKTPVLIYQGYSDKLVKPTGTFELYRAISVKDKDLVIVGHAEHLIFEEDQFDPIVVHGLVGWINEHLSQCQLGNGTTSADTTKD
jgi:alpha-beta hydrolase superfamily lysophospholipase